jgi:DNA-directed RNA polymerase specialized sigma24 family protein
MPESLVENSAKSVSIWIGKLRSGDEEAAHVIWGRFFERLVILANRKLKNSSRRAMDEEDVVQQAFFEFFKCVQNGRFPLLTDRDDLWQVLAMLVDRRAKDQMKRQLSLRAGSGRVLGESAFIGASERDVRKPGIAQVPDVDATPELASDFVDELQIRLGSLGENEYVRIAILKMQGYSNPEIADRIKSSLRTVERVLKEIREKWIQGAVSNV